MDNREKEEKKKQREMRRTDGRAEYTQPHFDTVRETCLFFFLFVETANNVEHTCQRVPVVDIKTAHFL